MRVGVVAAAVALAGCRTPPYLDGSDGAAADFAVRDFAVPDLAPADQAVPDFAVVDQTQPDLARYKWLPRASNVTDNLYSIWGSGRHDIYVAGANGMLLHSTDDG